MSKQSQSPLGLLFDVGQPYCDESEMLEEFFALGELGMNPRLFLLGAGRNFSAADVPPLLNIAQAPRWRWIPPPDAWFCQWRLLKKLPGGFRRALRHTLRRAESGRWRDWWDACWLADRMSDAGIEHVHGHRLDRVTAVMEIATLLTGTGYSITAHDDDVWKSSPQVLKRKLSGARLCLAPNGYTRDYLRSFEGGSDSNIQRNYRGVNINAHDPGDDCPTSVQAPPLLLACGRYETCNDFALLLDACALLREYDRDFRCQIVGEGELHLALQQRIDAAGLSRHVQLREPLPRDAMLALYRKAAVFVQTATIDSDGSRLSIPRPLFAAMAMELPCVGTHLLGIPEVIAHEQTGLLCKPDDPEQLAIAIGRLLDDRQLAARIGHNARRFVAEYFSADVSFRVLRDQLRRYCIPSAPSIRLDTSLESRGYA